MKPHYRILRLNHGRAPTVQHATLKEAETEALRLAGQHPGETFEILKVLGLARTTEPSIFWNDAVENPDGGTPDPGEGYRWLVAGDVIEAGDQYRLADDWGTFDPAVYGWSYGVPDAGGRAIYGHCRRKLPAPEHYPTTPLPEGFDRWVCRGEAWASEGGVVYTFFDLYDRTWFNGDCSVPEATAAYPNIEYWEAVKDEPTYRMLEPGEVIEAGDEWKTAKGGWTRAKHSIGALVATHARHRIRRPLNKKQAP